MKERSGEAHRLPVTVLSGFLGAGKTTLLNRALMNRELDRGHLGKKIGDMSVLKSPPIYVTYNGIGLPVTGNIDFPLGSPLHNPSKTHHLHGSPVFLERLQGADDLHMGRKSLRAWTIDLQTGAVAFVGKGAEVASAALAFAPTGLGGMPGGMLALSSNGQAPGTGVVWTLAPVDGDAIRTTAPTSFASD